MATAKEKGIDHAKELGRQNVLDLAKLVQWNDDHHIKFMRMSSEMFPFASHPDLGYDLDYCKDELKEVGDLAKKLGHRLTMHPGQFNQLGSKTEKVVTSTFRDLKYHAQILDFMGLDKNSVLILHMGGVYGDREAAVARWEENFQKLEKHIADRIVLENDEISYNVEQILPTCNKLKIPLVFDWHHHSLNPGTVPLETLLPQIAATWAVRGIRQKQHYSESRLGAETLMERRAHSDRVKSIPCKLDEEVDLMLEAKDKEQAVLVMYEKLKMFEVAEGTIWAAGFETKKVVDRTRKPKKEAAEGAEGDETPKKKRAPRKKAVKKEESDSEEVSDRGSEESEEEVPKKRKSPAKKTPVKKAAVKKETVKKEAKSPAKKASPKKRSPAKKVKVEDSESELDEVILDE